MSLAPKPPPPGSARDAPPRRSPLALAQEVEQRQQSSHAHALLGRLYSSVPGVAAPTAPKQPQSQQDAGGTDGALEPHPPPESAKLPAPRKGPAGQRAAAGGGGTGARTLKESELRQTLLGGAQQTQQLQQPLTSRRAAARRAGMNDEAAPLSATARMPGGELAALSPSPHVSPQRSAHGGALMTVPSPRSLVSPTTAGSQSPQEDLPADSPFHFIRKAARGEPVTPSFVYMLLRQRQVRAPYNPYDLRVVRHSDIDEAQPPCEEYYTLSAQGVQHNRKDEADFVPLTDWCREHRVFHETLSIPFFKKYRRWRTFYFWKKHVRRTIISACKDHLEENLFLLNSDLSMPLVEIRQTCLKVQDLSMYEKFTETRELTAFSERCARSRETTVRRLQGITQELRGLIDAACKAMMLSSSPRPVIEDQGEASVDGGSRRQGGRRRGELRSGAAAAEPERQSYIEQSQRRAVCRRLTAFIRLCDYMVTDSLVALAGMSVHQVRESVLYPKRQKSVAATEEPPPDEEMVMDAPIVPAKRKEFDGPAFYVEIIFQGQDIMVSPSLEEFVMRVEAVIKGFLDTIAGVQRFVHEEEFRKYTMQAAADQPGDEPGAGPDVREMVERDERHSADLKSIRQSLQLSFSAVEQHAHTFEVFRTMYHENCKLDRADVKRRDEDLAWFQEQMHTYKQQSEAIDHIELENTVAIFICRAHQLRSFMEPSPRECLAMLQDLLPEIAREKNTALLEELKHANMRLDSKPEKVEDFVDFDNFHQATADRLDLFRVQFDAIGDMYREMDIADPPIEYPKNDALLFYEGSKPQFDQLLQVIGSIEETKEVMKKDWNERVNAEIITLRTKMEDIHDRAQAPMIQDEEENVAEVISYVQGLMDDIDQVKDREKALVGYQESFQISDATPLNEIVEVHRDISDKLRLWTSFRDFQAQSTVWKDTVFSQLDAKVLEDEIARYDKTVKQVDRTLKGQNPVVHRLRGMVDKFRLTMPVISCLKNADLKEHHWSQIDEIVTRDLTDPNSWNLGVLFDLNCMDLRDEISAVSYQASQEQQLNQQLSSVIAKWGDVEFNVKPYKDQKDAYMLGAVDDIAESMDDSIVVISTIATSRYCSGGLKGRVERWEQDMRCMQETMDKWLELQRKWMYLESIFSNAELQRQWQEDARLFLAVDKVFRELLRKAHDNPNVKTTLLMGGSGMLLAQFKKDLEQLERVEKRLEDQLEQKRRLFPRFYFISNEDLIDILAQIKNPEKIAPHTLKMFDGVKYFGMTESSDITHMHSIEGEKVPVAKPVKARGPVENWLKEAEAVMMMTLRRLAKLCVDDYETRDRTEWMFEHAVQLVLSVSLVFWQKCIVDALSSDEPKTAMAEFKDICYQQLRDLAVITGRQLDKVQRKVLATLILLDVHGRDLVNEMVREEVSKVSDFGWTKQLRCYWELDTEGVGDLFIRQNTSEFTYGYEYMGAQGRLVITPLTDRIFMTITGALHLCLGASPSGPAGTGKTESVKDLAKGLGRLCIVFNCSDGVTYKMMEKFFSGLCQCGAWCCLDEFNRINIEVLSVVAQQLMEIREALLQQKGDPGMKSFTFQQTPNVELKPTFGCFITMNPGYAGRTELPDNLKALFRPVAAMTPDFRMIAEVIFYSEGFANAENLSLKITQLYKLSSEQLSPQNHYDFGMRALKSILVMAGDLKRSQPDVHEDLTLIVACNDANIPKFVMDDIPLFRGIMSDLFPGAEIPARDYPELRPAIDRDMTEKVLEQVPTYVTKIIQLYETLIVRHGVMMVGATGCGKTTAKDVLANSLTDMKNRGSKNPQAQLVHQHILNPKSIFMGELYGSVDPNTNEWQDGILPIVVKKNRQDADDGSKDHEWIVFDGPVDTLWVESMNSVLDDSKLLCLDNGVRMKLPETVHMMFEVADLAVASPATVSRCGMVFVDPSELGWTPIIYHWINTTMMGFLGVRGRQYTAALIEAKLKKGFKWLYKEGKQTFMQSEVQVCQTLCNLFHSLCHTQKVEFAEENPTAETDADDPATPLRNELIHVILAFCFVWAVGGNVNGESQEIFDVAVRDMLEDVVPFSGPHSVYDLQIDFHSRKFVPWEQDVPEFHYDPSTPFFDIIVPTVDTYRYSFLVTTLLSCKHSVLFNGATGTGKSVIMQKALSSSKDSLGLLVAVIQFSAKTSSPATQVMIESKLKAKKKNVLGGPIIEGRQHTVALFVDDLNMPALEVFGASPPIELVRQMIGNGGFYDRRIAGFWKNVQDVVVLSACGPPEGGRSPVTPRLTRFFTLLQIPNLGEEAMRKIFTCILNGFFMGDNFNKDVRAMIKNMVTGSADVYNSIRDMLRPRPATAHYTFNLRDLSKVFQGIMQVTPRTCPNPNAASRLWVHENMRCFYDRLISEDDRRVFSEEIMMRVLNTHFSGNWSHDDIFVNTPIIWGDFLVMGASDQDRRYEEVADIAKLPALFENYLEEYNIATNKNLALVFFTDHCYHLSRIVRIVRQPRGNALLVGLGGSGKQTLTRLAASICEFQLFQIEVDNRYDLNKFHEDLLLLYELGGVEGKPVVFLLNDSQIVDEGMTEDINNMLNSGEVPSLFPPEEKDKKINACLQLANELGRGGTREEVFAFFISRVRDNLHCVLCMSPVGDAFRTRCRNFPSLTNCCSIDWFDKWPNDALLQVAQRQLGDVDFGEKSAELRESYAQMCVEIHASVQATAERFYDELRRHYYVTPTSYLEFISVYLTLLEDKRKELGDQRHKVSNGTDKMNETTVFIQAKQAEITELRPVLEQKSKENLVMMQEINEKKASAEQVKEAVGAQEAEASAKAANALAIQKSAQADLDQAMPALNEAVRALDLIDKKDINEMKAYPSPPIAVEKTLNAVMILLKKPKFEWKLAKELMTDSTFIQQLKGYNRDAIDEPTIKKLSRFVVDDPDFTPDKVGSQGSAACKSLCMWCRALHTYYYVAKEVEPKKAKLEVAQAELAETNAKLEKAQSALRAVEAEMAQLQKAYDDSVRMKEELQHKLQTAERHLATAEVLTDSLGSEAIRWAKMIKEFDDKMYRMPGNVFFASGSIAYFGAFTPLFRQELVAGWVKRAKDIDLPMSADYSLVNTLGDKMKIREWQIDSLPTDNTSTENAILVSLATDEGMKLRRWPLMIDPQGQAGKWIRKMEARNGLKIIKLTDAKYLQVMKGAIQNGTPLLIDDVGETMDPAIDSVLGKQVYSPSSAPNQLYINIGSSDNAVHYEQSFRLYMTTKIANPHYLPEVCIKVTLLNFTVTMVGLEDQMLGEVVAIEQAELEESKNKIVKSVADDTKKLKHYEDRILSELEDAQGNILDNQKLIDTLKQAQTTSTLLSKRLVEAEEKAKAIDESRETYRPVANRASVLYFVLADLPAIDPMYQYSLEYFKKLVALVVSGAAGHASFDEHLAFLTEAITSATFSAVTRGLFNRHRTVFSLLICSAIQRGKGTITSQEWQFFNRAGAMVRTELPPKPDKCDFITHKQWGLLDALDRSVPAWKGVVEDICNNTGPWEEWFGLKEPHQGDVPGGDGGGRDWAGELTRFQKLLLLRAVREEKTLFASFQFIGDEMGEHYITEPQVDLDRAHSDSSSSTPIIFILSQGSDPTEGFVKWADERHGRKVRSISLGQGQEKPARALLESGKKAGDWVLLQNCHLGKSFMPGLQDIVMAFENDKQVKEDFRLWLTSMPADYFPVPVLQNSIKLTNEAPSGLKANLRRVYNDVRNETLCHFDTPGAYEPFPECERSHAYKKLLFGLAFFHSLIRERKKFGPLGWNVLYEWNDTDIQTSLKWLHLFIAENEEIPWSSMLYIIGEINYGGRVTDPIDRRALHAILRRYFTPQILDDGFAFSESGIYKAPSEGEKERYTTYIDQLPRIDEPEVFGMHDNASLRYQLQESQQLLKTVLLVQPRATSKSGDGPSPDEQVKQKATEIVAMLPEDLSHEEAGPTSYKVMDNGLPNSMSTVLRHEVDKFQKLMKRMRYTLTELQKALGGLTVLSESLERMYFDFLGDAVPDLWSQVSYPSLKPLGSWMSDMVARILHCREWLRKGEPNSYWLSGLFSPHGFMTGVLQAYARQFTISVDILGFSFQLLDLEGDQVVAGPTSGVYVHGLFCDSWRWLKAAHLMEDSLPGEMYSSLPVVYFLPEEHHKPAAGCYEAPLYITTVRKGNITSLGASSNFITKLEAPTDKSQDYWIAKGAAVVCQLVD